MKKLLQTILLVSLIIICGFLLLPFILDEQKNENTEQLRSAQPQLYSTNPLTALMQHAKDLFSQAKEVLAQGDRNDESNPKAKPHRHARAAAKKHSSTAKESAGYTPASAANDESSKIASAQGTQDFHSPKQYNFSLSPNTTANTAPAPIYAANENQPLFSAEQADPNSPAKGVKPRTPSKTILDRISDFWSKKTDIFTKDDPSANTATANETAALAASRSASYSAQDTNKAVQDIANMRANAQYPNPQTEAERLAREQLIQKERDRLNNLLQNLFWRSIKDPDEPQKPIKPEEEDYTDKDALASIIFDDERINVKSTPFGGESEEEAPSAAEKEAFLRQQLAKNNIRFDDLSAAQKEAFQKEVPLVVVLGSTFPDTLEKVKEELAALEEEEEAQKAQEQSDAQPDAVNETETDEANSDTTSDPHAAYKDSLEKYRWLMENSEDSQNAADEDYVWVLTYGQEDALPYQKSLDNSAALANTATVGVPNEMLMPLFEKYMEYRRQQEQENTQEDSEGNFRSKLEQRLNLTKKNIQAIQEFTKLSVYSRWTKEQMAQMAKIYNEQKANDTQNNQTAVHFYVSDPLQKKRLNGVLPDERTYVGKKAVQDNKTDQEFGRTILQSRIDNLHRNAEAAELLSAETADSAKEKTKQLYKQAQTQNQKQKK